MPRPTGNGGWPYRAEDEVAGAPAKTTKTPRAPEAVLEKIAKEKLALVTLATRKSDHLDFYDLAVWTIRDALQVAYQAGHDAAKRNSDNSGKK